MNNPSLVVVDDEIEMAGFVAEVAEVVGFQVSAVTSVQQLRKTLERTTPDVIVIDIFMPDTDGFELISELAEQECASGIILISGYGSTLLNGAGKIAESRGLHLLSVISKPFRLIELESVFETSDNKRGWQMKYRKRLLVLDDEPDIGEFVRDVAIESGYDAMVSADPEMFPSVYTNDMDVVVLDLMMPGTDGIEIIRFLAECGSNSSIILISGYNAGVLHSAQELASEHGLHVIGTLTKPIRYVELEQLLETAPALITARRKSDPGLFEKPGIDEFIEALENGQIIPHYQPQLDFASRALIGVEALVRWEHPRWGVLPAGLVLDLAREADLLGELTTSVLNQSLIQCRKWQDAGLKTLVAINMSADIFKDLQIPKMLEDELYKHRLDPSQIILEVTESALMQELVKSLDTLTRLRMKGIALSIDDFGTGYSSLVQLHRIPFSEMKIDRSFVINALSDEEALAIVKITIMLGHELGMKVVAEGIENQRTWDLLLSLGCDAAQGYYIAKPMPGDELLMWARSHSAALI